MHLVQVNQNLLMFLGITLLGIFQEIQNIGHHPEPIFHQHGALDEDNIVSTQSADDTEGMNKLPQVERQVDPERPTFISIYGYWGRQRLRSLQKWHEQIK